MCVCVCVYVCVCAWHVCTEHVGLLAFPRGVRKWLVVEYNLFPRAPLKEGPSFLCGAVVYLWEFFTV